MLQRFIAFVLILSIFTVQANAATNSGLKAAFDELNYSLTVEWNQKDKAFYTEQMKKFTAQLNELQVNGLTNSEIIEFVKIEVKDAKVAKDLETAFNMIAINKMSSQEASKYMVETMKKSYSAGASWNGAAGGILSLLGLSVLIVAVALVVSGGTYSSGPGYSCVNQYVCGTQCYFDPYWGYTCYDDCYWTCY